MRERERDGGREGGGIRREGGREGEKEFTIIIETFWNERRNHK